MELSGSSPSPGFNWETFPEITKEILDMNQYLNFTESNQCLVSQELVAGTHQQFQKIEDRKKLFTERFGALASHETNLPLNPIATLHDCTFKLKPDNDHFIIAFDANGYPYLKDNSKKHLDDDSCWEMICKRYRAYRGETDGPTARRMREIFADHAKIIQEFDAITPKEIDGSKDSSVISDFADKTTRIYIIEQEQDRYKQIIEAWRSSIDFSLTEKIVYSVASFFHSFFAASFDDLLSESSSLTTTKNFRASREVYLGRRMIVYDDKKTEIELKFKYNEWFCYNYVNITRVDTSEDLGYVSLRLFKQDEEQENLWSCPISAFQTPSTFYCEMHPAIIVNSGSLMDKPILKLLTQIAVELFESQSIVKLTIPSSHSEAAHYVVSGFWAYESFNQSQKVVERYNKIKDEVIESRKQNKLYPPFKDYTGINVNLNKSDYPISTEGMTASEKTKFIRYENGFVKPAIVEDGIAENGNVVVIQKTWEECIHENPVIPNCTRGLLPRIFSNTTNKI